MKLKSIKLKKVESTNDEALKLIKRNKTYPTMISSDNQSKGRGRMGKRWLSIRGNLFLSIFFEINRKIDFKQYAVLNAYLIRKILSKYVLRKINIKWPNDLLIGKKKFCGILQETINHKKKRFLIIGVGINTLVSPNINKFKTTYLSKFSKKKLDNNKILKDIKINYEKFIHQINQKDYLKIKDLIK